MNTRTLPSGVSLPVGNQYTKNVALKLQLNQLWTAADRNQRFDLAKYYVSTWGGVRGNKDSTLMKYVLETPTSMIGDGIKGIASWSKVLCIRNPRKYAIFDARVSTALNCSQIIGGVRNGELFPLLAGQNQTIKGANAKIKAHAQAHGWSDIDRSKCYKIYLDLINNVARTCKLKDTQIYTIEMLLFSYAEILVAKAFPSEKFKL